MNAEEVVRRYLLALNTPDALWELPDVAQLQENIANATDPVAKLQASSALHNMTRKGNLEEMFIPRALKWARENNVLAESFREMNVPREVLQKAGFYGDSDEPQQQERKNREHKSRNKNAQESVDAFIDAQGDARFTVWDVVANVDVERSTARRYINKAVEEGRAVHTGERQHTRRGGGGAPLYLYRRAQPSE